MPGSSTNARLRRGHCWPVAATIETPRLTLEPLRVEHADETVSILDDERLYEFIGGCPETLEKLRETYERQVVGHSADCAHGWLNWAVRHRTTRSVVGTVQATLHDLERPMMAEIAWIIGFRHQGSGYATEAGAAMVGWLRKQEVRAFAARIRPDHAASVGVARHLGLRATGRAIDGETLWIS